MQTSPYELNASFKRWPFKSEVVNLLLRAADAEVTTLEITKQGV